MNWIKPNEVTEKHEGKLLLVEHRWYKGIKLQSLAEYRKGNLLDPGGRIFSGVIRVIDLSFLLDDEN